MILRSSFVLPGITETVSSSFPFETVILNSVVVDFLYVPDLGSK